MILKAKQEDDDRFDRQKRIHWMDIEKINNSKVLVAGAGALGNETVKNLVLAGVGSIDIVDMDRIVCSNLNRCVFFSDSDIKGMKCDIVAEKASSLSPITKIKSIPGKVQDLEEWNYDVVLGCLDNISARLHVNGMCMYHKIPYVDGATDGMRGKIHTVFPNGACLQCSMNRTHVKEMEKRFSCTGNETMYIPKTASDITTTSVISAMQVRECLKILSGRKELCARDITYYDGTLCDMFTVSVDIDHGCPNHGE